MPLPKIATPSYELELPSTGKTIQYRPFLVKEEKLLVIALESEDTKQITNAIKAVIRSCVLTKGVKIETLPTFDIEFLFLNIRGKYVGEEIDVNLICPDDNETEVNVSVSLDDIQVQKPEGHSNQIKLDDNLIMELKYPSLNEFIKTNFDSMTDMKVDDTFDLISSCIDQVYSDEETWSHQECTKKELSDFVESLNSSQFKMVENFFTSMPKLSHTVKVTNPNTKVDSEIKLEGLQSFFG